MQDVKVQDGLRSILEITLIYHLHRTYWACFSAKSVAWERLEDSLEIVEVYNVL